MKRWRNGESFSITHLFIYGLAFLLLWEWLKPLPVITNIGKLHVFVLFALFSAVIIYFKVRVVISIPLLLLGSFFGLHATFGDGTFTKEGLIHSGKLFFSELAQNVAFIFAWELGNITNYFRTFLLFLLLGLICYLLYYWIFQTKRIFLFILSTVVYIAILDTFTVVDGSMAIIRIVIIGFFILTLLHMLTIQQQEKEIGKTRKFSLSPTWLYTLIVIVLTVTSVAYIAPKHEPQWEDPVPKIKKAFGLSNFSSGKGVRRVGYGSDDTILGGGFVQDDSIVFYAVVDEPVYWRGESKHEYTGHGWISEPVEHESHAVYGEEVDYYMYRDNVEVEEGNVKITMEKGTFNHLFYPGQLTALVENSLSYMLDGRLHINPDNITFLTDIIGGKITASHEEEDVVLKSYELQYQVPRFSIQLLQDDSLDDPESIKELYLQLPETLPERVYDLAEEIVAGKETRYEKVLAIESYFSSNDFKYETQNVPIPGENEDYVDQFLFETRFGYCDNFSTAMAVLLRAVDIPSRWVKGFTPGEKTTDEHGNTVYEVKNSNAHSWVEVYFPQVGWVPFEPTKGFENNVEFYEEEENEENVERDETGQDEREQDILTPPMGDLMHQPDAGFEGGASSGFRPKTNIFRDFEFFTTKNIFISLIVMIFVIVVYRNQTRLQNRFFSMKYAYFGSDGNFQQGYERLLWVLNNEGLPRYDGETLREYAKRVDYILGTSSMNKLTEMFEEVYYGGQKRAGDWEQFKQGWKEIMTSLNN